MLVVVPMVLLLGSVYVHVAAGRLSVEADHLAEEKAAAESRAERLQVRVEELSSPERIRESARRDLGMRDPSGRDIRSGAMGGEGERGGAEVQGDGRR
jgi:cell division protein FtsL